MLVCCLWRVRLLTACAAFLCGREQGAADPHGPLCGRHPRQPAYSDRSVPHAIASLLLQLSASLVMSYLIMM